MNPTTHETEGSAAAPVLTMALELSNRSWRLAFGDGAKQRQVVGAGGGSGGARRRAGEGEGALQDARLGPDGDRRRAQPGGAPHGRSGWLPGQPAAPGERPGFTCSRRAGPVRSHVPSSRTSGGCSKRGSARSPPT